MILLADDRYHVGVAVALLAASAMPVREFRPPEVQSPEEGFSFDAPKLTMMGYDLAGQEFIDVRVVNEPWRGGPPPKRLRVGGRR